VGITELADRLGQGLRAVPLVAVVAAGAGCLPAPVPGGAAGSAPALVLDQSTGLADGQEVGVRGTSFEPGRSVTVYQCAAEPVSMVDCDLDTATPVAADATGSFSAELPIFAELHSWQDPALDCQAPGACVVAASLPYEAGVAPVTAAIELDPGAPRLRPPVLSAAPASGLADGQTVRVTGSGFVRGDGRRMRGEPPVRVYQCAPGELGPGASCRAMPTVETDVDDGGRFSAEVPITAVTVGRFFEIVDCRRTSDPCYLLATRWPSVDAGDDVVGRADLHFDADGPLLPAPTPTIEAAPASGLQDGDDVAVTGDGLPPGYRVTVQLCRTGTTACDQPLAETVGSDAAGTFEAVVGGRAAFDATTGGHVDCRIAPGCSMQASVDELELHSATPVAFGPPDEPRRYVDPVFDEVDVERDVVYRDTTDSSGHPVQLRVDIFRPAGDSATSRPAIVWMHGGFFRAGDKTDMHPDAIASARRGYVGVALQYRLRPDASSWREMYLASLDAYDDATAGVRWLQDHAADYGIDPETIVAGGDSAGAVTAFNLAYLPGQRGPAEPLIAAAVPRGGILYTEPERGDPPVVAFHGTLDDITPFENVADVCDLATSVDVACQLVTYDGARHTYGPLEDVHHRLGEFLATHVLAPRGQPGPPRRLGWGYSWTTRLRVGSVASGVTCSSAWASPSRVPCQKSSTVRVTSSS
jgi:predicted esterase